MNGFGFLLQQWALIVSIFYDNTGKFAEVLAIYKSMYRWYLVVAFSDKKTTTMFSPLTLLHDLFAGSKDDVVLKAWDSQALRLNLWLRNLDTGRRVTGEKKTKKKTAPLLDPKLVNGWRAGYTTSPPLRLAASLSQWWVTTGDSRYQS